MMNFRCPEDARMKRLEGVDDFFDTDFFSTFIAANQGVQGPGHLPVPPPPKKERKRKEYKCIECDYFTLNYVEWKKHNQTNHKKDVPRRKSCRYCNYIPTDNEDFQKHNMIHKKSRYKCEFCDYTSQYPSHVSSHMRSKHTQEKPYKCSLCDYRTVQSSHLKPHFLSKHSDVKPYKCDLCPYASAQSGNLKTHILKVHTEDLPYKCEQCDYAAPYPGSLKTHVMDKHSDDRPHKCTFCDFSTVYVAQLKTHVLSKHTNLRPYACDYCDYATPNPVTLRWHLRAKHQVFKSSRDREDNSGKNQKKNTAAESEKATEEVKEQENSEEFSDEDSDVENGPGINEQKSEVALPEGSFNKEEKLQSTSNESLTPPAYSEAGEMNVESKEEIAIGPDFHTHYPVPEGGNGTSNNDLDFDEVKHNIVGFQSISGGPSEVGYNSIEGTNFVPGRINVRDMRSMLGEIPPIEAPKFWYETKL